MESTMSNATIHFVDPAGETHDVSVAPGWTLMEAAVQKGVPGIVAECGGSCACATCHVTIAEEWLAKLPPPEDMEQEMLTCTATPATAHSRLSCQVKVTGDLDGMVVRIAESQV
jgi:ferredoxin, 2Fe-2S